MASKPQASDRSRIDTACGDDLADASADGPPDFRTRLLDDGAGFMKQRDIPLGGCEHPAIEVEKAGAGAAGADIDADDMFGTR